MNTFLPYPSFSESARVLDYKRLGKQRIEVLQILRVLAGESRGWQNHPAIRMWRGYGKCLAEYGLAVCREWKARGYRDSVSEKIEEFSRRLQGTGPDCPPWLGNRDFHLAHQSNLVRKNPDYYRKIFKEVPDNLPYVWPEHKERAVSDSRIRTAS